MTGVILSGGKNTRMGTNKAFLRIAGERLIDRNVKLFKELFDEVIVVTNEPRLYIDLDVIIVSDVIKDRGSLGGIYSGIFYAASNHCFVAACDMPFLNRQFIEYMITCVEQYDIVVPEPVGKRPGWMEPLHAVYSKNCLPLIKSLLLRHELKIAGLFKGVNVRVIPEKIVKEYDQRGQMFLNINTREEMERLASTADGTVTGRTVAGKETIFAEDR